ncbi:TRNA/rRNA_cytosine-C5-methylase [Hexamita inflata]|uniref:tRNA/rRNA_cytosine-C5-methylase n=1 Tax=Hexamita inflata TaxID=28002 RepID=A0ABP1HC40_9EUKA
MPDIYKQAAESLFSFQNRVGGLKALCLAQNSSPSATYALSTAVMDNYENLKSIKGITCDNSMNYFHQIVLLHEFQTNGFPNKRLRLSKETRNTISFLKANVDLEPLKAMKPAAAFKPVANRYFRIFQKTSITEFAAALKELNITYTQTQFKNVVVLSELPPSAKLTQFGEFQSIGSCLPVLCFQSIVDKGTLLDLCAAPGSKSLQASESFTVTANELDKRRFNILKKRCEPQNITCINADAFDTIDRIRSNQFDLILLDPTCSSSGTYNQDKALALKLNVGKEKDLEKLVTFQKTILLKALTKGAERGVKYVSYSTCSINDEENEQVVEFVLEQNKKWKLVNVLEEWEVRGLRHKECVRCEEPGNGFFVAVFQRK